MKSEFLVSVIVPAYNCEMYLTETLESLFNQDYFNIEIIVVNDGSKDNTLELLKTYGKKIVLVNQVNSGASAARNNGIKVARGEFISFCDSDDIWAPQKIRAQVDYLENHPTIGMVYSDWHVWISNEQNNFIIPPGFGSSSKENEILQEKSGWIYHKLLLDCICLTSTVMLRTEIVDKLGGFEPSLRSGEDYDYWLKASRITEIHKLKSKYVLYRSLPQSLANTPTKIHYEYEVLKNAVNKWGLISPNGEQCPVSLIKDRYSNMRFSFGYLHLNTGTPKIAVQCFWSSITYRIFRYKSWLYLLLGVYRLFSSKIYGIFIAK